MIENEDYELILPPDAKNDQAWNVRILTGEFNETVIRFGNIGADGKKGHITFNFVVVYAPSEYIDETNVDLQIVVGQILGDVLDRAARDGSLVLDEND